jgi:hypothetical protein
MSQKRPQRKTALSAKKQIRCASENFSVISTEYTHEKEYESDCSYSPSPKKHCTGIENDSSGNASASSSLMKHISKSKKNKKSPKLDKQTTGK